METATRHKKTFDAIRTDTTRLETFSDAVFAFSATLLVVSLEVPDNFPQLVTELKGFVAFGIRFGVLLVLWSVHHAFFRRYSIADGMTIFLNSCLLFVILFYVYPMKFLTEAIVAPMLADRVSSLGISSAADLALIFILYSAGFVAIFSFVVLMYLHAYRQREKLQLTRIESLEARFYARHYGFFVAVALFSIVLAAFHVGIGFGLPGFVYMLLGPLCYGHAIAHNRRIAMLSSDPS